MFITEFFGNYFGYMGNYMNYQLWETMDILWSPLAITVNGFVGLLSGILDLVLTAFAWSNIPFSYFMVATLLIFIFSLLVKILLWLKDVLLRWL